MAALAAAAFLQPAPSAAQTSRALRDLENDIIRVAKEVTPSVVFIEAVLRRNNDQQIVTGSGIIFGRDGVLFTNQHVIENATKVTVTVPGIRESFAAEVLGEDAQTDFAVIRIDPGKHAKSLRPAKFGKSADLKVGSLVLAIGNPYALDGSVSFGIVQAKGRNLRFKGVINEFIQTDALIDQGSSGGPLVNFSGEVVGINSIAAGRGIGLTIPIETALGVHQSIMERGSIRRGWLGVSFQPLTRKLASYWKLQGETGAVVNRVMPGSPADAAGLRPGDIVTRFGGTEVDVPDETDVMAFTRMVAATQPGEVVEIVRIRDGQPATVKVTVGTQPKVRPETVETQYGFFVQDITTDVMLTRKLDSMEGAIVSYVVRGGPADEVGMLPGDVIRRIEGRAVKNLDDVRAAIKAVEGLERFMVEAERSSDLRFYLIERRREPGVVSTPAP